MNNIRARASSCLKKSNEKVGTSAYNAAIAACGHAGSALDALPILADMKKRGVPRSVITYRFAKEIAFFVAWRGGGENKIELKILELIFPVPRPLFRNDSTNVFCHPSTGNKVELFELGGEELSFDVD